MAVAVEVEVPSVSTTRSGCNESRPPTGVQVPVCSSWIKKFDYKGHKGTPCSEIESLTVEGSETRLLCLKWACLYNGQFICGLASKVIAAVLKWLVRLPLSRNSKSARFQMPQPTFLNSEVLLSLYKWPKTDSRRTIR
jgi:hypothetical protein